MKQLISLIIYFLTFFSIAERLHMCAALCSHPSASHPILTGLELAQAATNQSARMQWHHTP